jgi:tRNA-specific 2-thiouridylase
MNVSFPDDVQPPARVAVGMSGGLDSSVVAALLAGRGFEVIGLTLRLFREGSRCCSQEDIERSQRVCHHLGLKHYSVNAIDLFDRRIIQPFVEEYLGGRTPSPCVLCNQHIKFGILQERALQLGCTHVATGHYVRLERRPDGWHLLRARDAKKDQSYFLHRLSQAQLGRSLFPLAGLKKTEVAQYAREKELPVDASSKSESQDLCFVSNDGHGALVEQYRPERRGEGPIVDGAGRRLGTHPGIHHFTIGQRRGLKVAAPHRLYVRRIQPETNTLVLGRADEVCDRSCRVRDMHWIAGAAPAAEFDADVRIRYRHPAARARVWVEDGGRLRLEFDEPQFAITPGQAAVLYAGDEVLGGGWIESPPAFRVE